MLRVRTKQDRDDILKGFQNKPEYHADAFRIGEAFERSAGALRYEIFLDDRKSTVLQILRGADTHCNYVSVTYLGEVNPTTIHDMITSPPLSDLLKGKAMTVIDGIKTKDATSIQNQLKSSGFHIHCVSPVFRKMHLTEPGRLGGKLPDGYKAAPLQPGEGYLDTIKTHWPEHTTGDVILSSVGNLPTVGLFHDGELAAYGMVVPQGGIGKVHVEPAHRGKGLARSIISYLSNDLARTKLMDAPTVRVNTEKVEAEKAYERMGFTLVPDSDSLYISFGK